MHKKRFEQQFLLYQTYAFNMVPLIGLVRSHQAAAWCDGIARAQCNERSVSDTAPYQRPCRFANYKFATVRPSRIKKRRETSRLFFVCVRQNLVFRAIFESVSDDKYFLLPCVNKKDHYLFYWIVAFAYMVSWISTPHLNWNSISCFPSTFMPSIRVLITPSSV